ncbi:MAG TPA: YwiC-like family protein [Ignavibacteriales bacterium]|nr:YwiC-like family protein [Ignavibacteriales bacterium]
MKPVITREHGSWAVLFIPVLTGITASRAVDFSVVLFIISIFSLFMSYTPAEMILQNYYKKMPVTEKLKNARNWFFVYISLSLLAGLPIIFVYNKPGLIFFAGAALVFFISSLYIMFTFRKNVWSDFLAMAGLTLSAPAVVYLTESNFTSKGLILYLLNVLFFGSSAFYVHMKMKLSSLKKQEVTLSEKLTIGRLNLLYNGASVVLLALFILQYPSKLLAAIAFFPMILHAVAGTFKLPGKVSYKKIGLTFLAYSLVFFLMMSLSGL